MTTYEEIIIAEFDDNEVLHEYLKNDDDFLAKIDKIDISHNIYLNNDLVNELVSKCINLRYLDISFSNIHNLKLEYNDKLIHLNASCSELMFLDASPCESLEHLDLSFTYLRHVELPKKKINDFIVNYKRPNMRIK